MDLEKATYHKRHKELVQDSIVNFKCATTSTIESYTWTFRNTACDVISIITTTVPLKNGVLKELKSHNKEMKRIKTPLRKPGTFLSVHPFEEKYTPSRVSEKEKKNEALWSEHKIFMKKLQVSRYLRSSVETLAATYIQKIFRGFFIRARKEFIKDSYIVKKRMRLQIREYIITNSKSKGERMILTLGEHRKHYKEWRYQSASTIQRGFRCFLGRICLKRTRFEVLGRRKLKAVKRIQTFVRLIHAIRRVGYLKYLKLEYNMARGARLLQTAFRSLIARRKVSRRRYLLHWLAARIIQCCYRYYCANALVTIMKQRFIAVKTSSNAMTIQCFVRQRVAVRKIDRLISVRFHHLVHMYSSKIQSVIRGHLARTFVKKISFFLTAETKRRRRQSNLHLVNSLTSSSKSGAIIASPMTYLSIAEDLNISKHQGQVKGSVFIINYSINPLQMAIRNRNFAEVKSLLSTTAMTSEIATDLLILSIQSLEESSDPVMLTFLLESGLTTYINDIHKKSGMTVLQSACLEGDLKSVEILLAKDADKSITDKMGHTALHKACSLSASDAGGSRLPLVYLLLGDPHSFEAQGLCV